MIAECAAIDCSEHAELNGLCKAHQQPLGVGVFLGAAPLASLGVRIPSDIGLREQQGECGSNPERPSQPPCALRLAANLHRAVEFLEQIRDAAEDEWPALTEFLDGLDKRGPSQSSSGMEDCDCDPGECKAPEVNAILEDMRRLLDLNDQIRRRLELPHGWDEPQILNHQGDLRTRDEVIERLKKALA